MKLRTQGVVGYEVFAMTLYACMQPRTPVRISGTVASGALGEVPTIRSDVVVPYLGIFVSSRAVN